MSNLQVNVMVFDDYVFRNPIRIDNSWITKLQLIDVAENERFSLRKWCNDTCLLKIPEQRTAKKIAYIYNVNTEQHFIIDEIAFNELFEMLDIK